jgi:hypothetical protein
MMNLNRFSIENPRQRRAVEALVERDSIQVQEIGTLIGALNPRQTIMELRRQGFDGIIKTRRFRQQDRDKKMCWPGEYYIPPEYKPLMREVLKRYATSVCQRTEAAKNNPCPFTSYPFIW